MRIQPIESPRNPLLRLMYWAMNRQFGKPITPAKVIFTRVPRAIAAQLGIYFALAGEDGIPMGLKLLLQSHVATMNGCSFCVDIGRAMATYEGLTFEKLDAVASYRTSPLFTPAERAALDVAVAAGSVPNAVTDETFLALKKHWTEEQIVEIIAVIAIFGFLNRWNDTFATPLEDEPAHFAEDHLAAHGWTIGKHAR